MNVFQHEDGVVIAVWLDATIETVRAGEAAQLGETDQPVHVGMRWAGGVLAPPELPEAERFETALRRLRRRRDQLLAACDWTQGSDSPLGPELKAAWSAYRQALRNLPEECAADPEQPVWPEPPTTVPED